ncbi:MAG: response regulator [Polyangiaceae bacterium]
MPTVLFVDDEPALLSATRRSLRSEPYEVFTAESAQEALELFEKHDIDVVVSDARMPVVSGFAFLEKVKERSPSTVRIMLTGEADLSSASALIQSGDLYRFLSKPLLPPALRSVVSGALAMRRWRREAELHGPVSAP